MRKIKTFRSKDQLDKVCAHVIYCWKAHSQSVKDHGSTNGSAASSQKERSASSLPQSLESCFRKRQNTSSIATFCKIRNNSSCIESSNKFSIGPTMAP